MKLKSDTVNYKTEYPLEKEPLYIRKGEYIFFGSYPQSQVTDKSVIADLSKNVGTPYSPLCERWTSYKYFSEGQRVDIAWFADIDYKNERYRGVFIGKYRPNVTTAEATDKQQNNTDYKLSTIYWFKYEPVKWKILEEGDIALLVSEKIIDVGDYFHSKCERIIEGVTVYPNNYAHSNIRSFLNNVFYETAFSPKEREIIVPSNVENGEKSCNPDNNPTYYKGGKNEYICEDSRDNVFLLSEQEITRTIYGFDADCSSFDLARQKTPTPYAVSQGAIVSEPLGKEYDPALLAQNSPNNNDFTNETLTNTETKINSLNELQNEQPGDTRNNPDIIKGNTCWWLRSPHYDCSTNVRGVTPEGYADYYFYYVLNALCGIVPALRIELN